MDTTGTVGEIFIYIDRTLHNSFELMLNFVTVRIILQLRRRIS